MPRATFLLLTLATLTLPSCRATRPSHLPQTPHPTALLAIKSSPLPATNPFWKSWAHHAWIDLRRAGSPHWERIESGGRLGILHTDLPDEEARLDRRFGERPIRLLGWLEGDDAEHAITALDRNLAQLAPHYTGDAYTMWPGPNSNTFVRELCAGVPDLSFVFDPGAVGKDYSPWLGIGPTASKTGLRVDTPLLGAAVGLREGVELHLLQLTLGISLDPPGISLPFLPQIPWGWFGADDARLVPPPVPGATRLTLDADTLTGERRALGVFGPGFVLQIVRPDERAWLRIDVTVGPTREGLRSHDVALQVERHEQAGISSYGTRLPLDPLATPTEQRLQCDAAVILLDLQATTDGRVAIGARCFADLEQEFAASQR